MHRLFFRWGGGQFIKQCTCLLSEYDKVWYVSMAKYGM